MPFIRFLCRGCPRCDLTEFHGHPRFPVVIALIACAGLAIHGALLAQCTTAPSIAAASFVLGVMATWLWGAIYRYLAGAFYIVRIIKARNRPI